VNVVGPVAVILIAVTTVWLDQVTKAGAARWGLGLLRNRRGAILGLGFAGAVALWVFLLGGSLVLASTARPSGLAIVALGLAVGGGAGNLLDRSRAGEVIDFVAIGWWPTFNLADVALVSGAVLAVVDLVGIGFR
jgi:signal peptidase II